MHKDLMDFSSQNQTLYDNFINKGIVQKMLRDIFPGYVDVNPSQIFVYSYVSFRQKYLIEIIVQYKTMLIPLQLDFVTIIKRVNDNTIELPDMYGYKSKFYVDNGKYNSNFFLTVMPRESTKYNHKLHTSFFGEKESEIFNKFYNIFYKKGEKSINYTQKVFDSFTNPDRHLFLDVKSNYQVGDQWHYLNITTDDITPSKKSTEFCFDVRSNNHTYGAKSKFSDLEECMNNDLKTLPELFRQMLLRFEDITDELIPYCENHIELFDYYDKNLDTIRTIKKMVDI